MIGKIDMHECVIACWYAVYICRLSVFILFEEWSCCFNSLLSTVIIELPVLGGFEKYKYWGQFFNIMLRPLGAKRRVEWLIYLLKFCWVILLGIRCKLFIYIFGNRLSVYKYWWFSLQTKNKYKIMTGDFLQRFNSTFHKHTPACLLLPFVTFAARDRAI